MRIFIAIIISTVLIFSAGLWVNDSLQEASDHLSERIEMVCQDIKSNDWENARDNINKLELRWGDYARWWPIIIDHQEMDNIEFSLARAKEYINEEKRSLALGQLAEIRLMVKHLPEKEKVNLKNIL